MKTFRLAFLMSIFLSLLFTWLGLNLLNPQPNIYKSQLENSLYGSASGLSSAKQNLATAFVNAFVNCGYGTDKL